MKEELLINIDNPKILEKLYRDNKVIFKREFNLLYPELTDNKIADFWNERLNYENTEISWGTGEQLTFVIFASLFAGIAAKLPELLDIPVEIFYPRNIGFIVFPFLTAYFIWIGRLSSKKIAIISGLIIISLLYINIQLVTKT